MFLKHHSFKMKTSGDSDHQNILTICSEGASVGFKPHEVETNIFSVNLGGKKEPFSPFPFCSLRVS